MKKTALLLTPAVVLALAFLFLRSQAQAGAARPTAPRAIEASNSLRSVSAEGRVVTYPGYEVEIGSDFAGTVSRVLVDEKSEVRKGEVLAEIDASEERAALRQAEARVLEAAADLKLAELEVNRAAQLLESKVGTRQALEKAERDRDASLARRSTASADVERLRALVRKSVITAPISGTILTRHISAGETVQRGTPSFVVADLERVRIEAEVDEMDSGHITVGAPVRIAAEGGGEWTGRVEEIPNSVAAKKLKPQDPAKPVDTRVLLVKVALDSKTGLKLGRRVELEIGGR